MPEMLKFLVIIAAILFPHMSVGQEHLDVPQSASMVELLANPAKYDGELVGVTAFLGLDPPDGSMLYLHKEDYDNGILMNAILIDVNKEIWADREKLDANYVVTVGIFRSNQRSHNRYSAITKIRTCSLWSQIENPIRNKFGNLHKHGSRQGNSQEPLEK